MNYYLVTGAASGLGRAIAQVLSDAGYTVFSADIDKKKLASAPGITVEMDITSTASIRKALTAVKKHTTGLDGIVNAAGVMRTGTMVEAREKDLDLIMDVNVKGMFRVNQVFMDMLHERKGRVVSISSETARFAAGFNGMYSMTKYAVEAYSDALRRELQLLGMKVVIIQPGPVMTPLLGSNREIFLKAASTSRYFKPQLEKIARLVVGEEKKAVPPEKVGLLVKHALETPRPRIRYRINNDRGRAFVSYLPARWADWLMKKALED